MLETKQDPFLFVNSIKEDEIENILNMITDILLTSYICNQFGFYESLSKDDEEIFTTSGQSLATKLGFKISSKYNDVLCLWTRKNVNNYIWMYKVWVGLNKKYFNLYNEPFKYFKFSFLIDNSDGFPRKDNNDVRIRMRRMQTSLGTGTIN